MKALFITSTQTTLSVARRIIQQYQHRQQQSGAADLLMASLLEQEQPIPPMFQQESRLQQSTPEKDQGGFGHFLIAASK